MHCVRLLRVREFAVYARRDLNNRVQWCDSGRLFHFPLDWIVGEYSIVQLGCLHSTYDTESNNNNNKNAPQQITTIKTDTNQFIITHLDKVAKAIP